MAFKICSTDGCSRRVTGDGDLCPHCIEKTQKKLDEQKIINLLESLVEVNKVQTDVMRSLLISINNFNFNPHSYEHVNHPNPRTHVESFTESNDTGFIPSINDEYTSVIKPQSVNIKSNLDSAVKKLNSFEK